MTGQTNNYVGCKVTHPDGSKSVIVRQSKGYVYYYNRMPETRIKTYSALPIETYERVEGIKHEVNKTLEEFKCSKCEHTTMAPAGTCHFCLNCGEPTGCS